VTRMLRRVEDPWFDGELLEYETEPGSWEKVLVLGSGTVRKPVVIVPFYDVDTPAGLDLGGRNFAMTAPVIWFARQAAQRGYLAVAVRWYGESYGERYDEAVASLGTKHPGLTGLGKWVNDSRKLIDYLVTRSDVDPDRIAMMGHSLGGKMTMYASAFDSRIKAAVVSDPGVPLASTNYSDYWYLGDKAKSLSAGTDHHELVGLIAPRAFLVVAGQADDALTWSFLEAARGLWSPDILNRRLGWIHHATGHRPPADAMSQAWDWLDANLRDENGWERLGEGTYHLTSDPAVDENGVMYFTDARRDRIMKVDLDGKVSVWRQGTHQSHGLAYSRKDRRLYAGQHDLKRIGSFSLDSSTETVVAQGLTTHHLKTSSKGRLYFNEAPAHKVWMLDKPGEGTTPKVVHGGLNWPRGIALYEGGGDRNFLTVSDPGTRWIWRFQIAGDGSLTGGRAFCELAANATGGLDPGGMAFDEEGFLYVATDAGIQVCDGEGRVTSRIAMPGVEGATNVAFAGPGLRWLYMTDGARLYRRPMPRRGARVQEQ
jgi:sugar lactone lactonase YvrE/dienelactone hydrolase